MPARYSDCWPPRHRRAILSTPGWGGREKVGRVAHLGQERDMRTDTFDAKLALIRDCLSALPFGWIGVVAMMLVVAGAFALGQIAFFGLEFLTHWPLFLGGWFAGLVVLSAIWGTGIECFVWSRFAYAALSRQVAHFVV